MRRPLGQSDSTLPISYSRLSNYSGLQASFTWSFHLDLPFKDLDDDDSDRSSGKVSPIENYEAITLSVIALIT